MPECKAWKFATDKGTREKITLHPPVATECIEDDTSRVRDHRRSFDADPGLVEEEEKRNAAR